MSKNGVYLEDPYKPVALRSLGPNSVLGHENFSM